MLDVLFFTSRKGQIPYFDLAVSGLKTLAVKNIYHKDIPSNSFSGFRKIPFSSLWSVAKYKVLERQSSEENRLFKLRWQLTLPFKWLQLILRFLNYYAAFEKEPSVIVAVWNGLKERPAVASLAGKALDRKVVFFEIGVMPHTTVLDQKGITAESSIPKDLKFYEKNRFDLKYGQIPLRKIETRATNIHKDKSTLNTLKLPSKYIFVPFQQVDDSSILLHSKMIKSMYQLYDWIEFVASNVDDNLFFVLKEHPSDRRDYRKLYTRDSTGRVLFANGNATQELIENAEAIITINSMVGMEALIHHKKVITLGDSWFNFEGVSRQASSKEELLEIVLSIDKWGINVEVLESYLSYVFYDYSIPGAYHSPDNSHWLNVEKKLNLVVGSGEL